MSEYGGWTGRLLSVDLTRGELHVEESSPWLPQHIGAAGLGLALVWERVPPGAGALEPENLLFLGVGPLTGTWAPCAGRAVAVSLAPAAYPVEHVAQGSVGGRWPAMLKWAGLDGVAITGRAAGPVCLVIHDDEFANGRLRQECIKAVRREHPEGTAAAVEALASCHPSSAKRVYRYRADHPTKGGLGRFAYEHVRSRNAEAARKLEMSNQIIEHDLLRPSGEGRVYSLLDLPPASGPQ